MPEEHKIQWPVYETNLVNKVVLNCGVKQKCSSSVHCEHWGSKGGKQKASSFVFSNKCCLWLRRWHRARWTAGTGWGRDCKSQESVEVTGVQHPDKISVFQATSFKSIPVVPSTWKQTVSYIFYSAGKPGFETTDSWGSLVRAFEGDIQSLLHD